MKKDPPRLRSTGFTLLELMITITVLAIIVGIGVPSFTNIIRTNRLASQTNEMLASFAVARSEAVKRGTLVTMCPANAAQNNCAGTDVWSDGWIVFSDTEGTVGQIDADGTLPDDMIIQRSPPPSALKINITNTGVTLLSYRGDGGANMPPPTPPTPANQTNFIVAPVDCSADSGARQVQVIAAGRAGATRIACP
jgi:type IV fimbrial biogenesis protein FimT